MQAPYLATASGLEPAPRSDPVVCAAWIWPSFSPLMLMPCEVAV